MGAHKYTLTHEQTHMNTQTYTETNIICGKEGAS